MKKFLIVFVTLTIMLLSGCGRKEEEKAYDKVYYVNNKNELSEEDAAEAYALMMETIANHTRELKPEDIYYGGHTLSLIVVKDGKMVGYSFGITNLYIFENDGTVSKQLNMDYEYFVNDFYPFFAKLGHKYFPAYYQQLDNFGNLKIQVLKDGQLRDMSIEEGSRLQQVSQYVAYNFFSAEKYEGSTDSANFVVIMDDDVVREELYFFDDGVVVSGKKVVTPAEVDLDILEQ